jgi:hypothetical protein
MSQTTVTAVTKDVTRFFTATTDVVVVVNHAGKQTTVTLDVNAITQEGSASPAGVELDVLVRSSNRKAMRLVGTLEREEGA